MKLKDMEKNIVFIGYKEELLHKKIMNSIWQIIILEKVYILDLHRIKHIMHWQKI